jgi:3-oxoacyl-[acyl-carrier protein] reductase
MLLKNRTVLVTGVGKGIGKAILLNAAKNGAFVYGITRSKKDLMYYKNIKNVKIFHGDVTKSKDVKKIFYHAKKYNHNITGLVNNAGIRLRKKFLQISKIDLQNVFENNFFSAFFIIQIFLNFSKDNSKLSIVNIGSIVGKLGFSELSAYASSKAALNALSKCIAAESINKKLRINTINPGFVKTSYFEKFKKNKKKLYEWTISRTPAGRWGESEEVANLAIFLLSSNSEFINGEDISIDGGWSNV